MFACVCVCVGERRDIIETVCFAVLVVFVATTFSSKLQDFQCVYTLKQTSVLLQTPVSIQLDHYCV